MTDNRQQPGIRGKIGIPPTDAVEFFRAKGTYPPSAHWTNVWQEEHARAFTVAKIANRRLLEDIRDSLDTVIAQGGTFDEWKKAILPTLQREGWWGRVDRVELTGVDRPVTVGDRRLRTIFDTNVRAARAAGRWKKIVAAKDVAPFLRYSAVMDGRTRPLHALWHATILPVDHPWWDHHYPPNGWHCRCTVTQHSARDLRVRGWKVSEAPPAEGRPQPFRRRGSGTVEQVPAGVDPGFAYNVGKYHLSGLQPPLLDRPIAVPTITPDLPPLPPARPRDPATILPPDTPRDEAIDRFMARFDGPTDGITKVSTDVMGEPLVIGPDFFDHFLDAKRSPGRLPSIELLADALADPDEIWWVWEEPRSTLASPRIRRRYLARFDLGDKTRVYGVVVETAPDGWSGVTAFLTRNEAYADRAFRGGVLAYRRNE